MPGDPDRRRDGPGGRQRGPAGAPSRTRLAAIADLLARGNVLVLTGAGISTDSGIPDYRGPDGTRRVTPMQYAEFLGSSEARQRYWARSYVGWQRFNRAGPTPVTRPWRRSSGRGLVGPVITQNVDGLHQAAGATDVEELHGSLARVVCLTCGDRTSRWDLDDRMREGNPRYTVTSDEIRPDGDIVLQRPRRRCLPHAAAASSAASDTLKPDVVFFGESVPKPLVEKCFRLTEQASALVVLGSSLKVMSGYRFVRRAAALGIPVAIITRGPTRGDAEATVQVDAPLAPTLEALLLRLAA